MLRTVRSLLLPAHPMIWVGLSTDSKNVIIGTGS